MIREIQIGDEKVPFKASGALPVLYRQETGRDFFNDIQTLGSGSDKILDLAWVMYKHADPDAHEEKLAWLERFEFMELNNALSGIVEMLTDTQKTTSSAKKKSGK